MLDADSITGVERIVGRVKDRIGQLGADYRQLTDTLADLKTIDAQLTSSRPKTVIIRECLRSVSRTLEPLDRDLAHLMRDFIRDGGG